MLDSRNRRQSRWIRQSIAVMACWCLMALPALSAQEPAAGAAPKAAEAPAGKAEPAHADTGHAKADENHAAGAQAAGAHAADQHSGAAGAHHDPYDLSHQNAGPQIEDPSQWKADLALATFVVFVCLLILLAKFAWGPLMAGLAARERSIAENIESARRSAETAASELRKYEAKLAAATEEAREILNQARRDADTARERILAEAQALAQRERQRAVEDIQSAKNAALEEMTQKSVDLAVSMAGRLVRRQLNRDDHAQLIREMIEKMPSPN